MRKKHPYKYEKHRWRSNSIIIRTERRRGTAYAKTILLARARNEWPMSAPARHVQWKYAYKMWYKAPYKVFGKRGGHFTNE